MASAVTVAAAALPMWAPVATADDPPPCDQQPAEQQQQCQQQKNPGAGIATGRPMRLLLNGVDTCWPLGVPLPAGSKVDVVPATPPAGVERSRL
jgi:hypothetical protein